MMAKLGVYDLAVRYGKLTAISDLSLAVAEGERLGAPNGIVVSSTAADAGLRLGDTVTLDRLGTDRMWHSISAGVRAAREEHEALVGHNGSEDVVGDYVPGEERIVAAHPDDEPEEELDPVPEKRSRPKKKHKER